MQKRTANRLAMREVCFWRTVQALPLGHGAPPLAWIIRCSPDSLSYRLPQSTPPAPQKPPTVRHHQGAALVVDAAEREGIPSIDL